MTHLRKIMLEELQYRNYSDDTIRHYLQVVEEFARHFGKSPDKLGLDHLRAYQAYLLKQRKLAVGSVVNHVAVLRFLYVRTLKRPEFREFLPYPRERQRLPGILSKEEVARLINASRNLFRRTLLMVLYGTGMRRAEVARLKIGDIDSQRMIIRVVEGKGGKDRDLPLSPALLETLRAYWRWRKPKVYFAGSRSRSKAPWSRDRLPQHPPPLGTEPPGSSPYPLRHPRRWTVSGPQALDPSRAAQRLRAHPPLWSAV